MDSCSCQHRPDSEDRKRQHRRCQELGEPLPGARPWPGPEAAAAKRGRTSPAVAFLRENRGKCSPVPPSPGQRSAYQGPPGRRRAPRPWKWEGHTEAGPSSCHDELDLSHGRAGAKSGPRRGLLLGEESHVGSGLSSVLASQVTGGHCARERGSIPAVICWDLESHRSLLTPPRVPGPELVTGPRTTSWGSWRDRHRRAA